MFGKSKEKSFGLEPIKLYVLVKDLVRCVLPEVEIFRLFVSSHNELWVASRMKKGLYRINQEGQIRKSRIFFNSCGKRTDTRLCRR